MLNKFINVLKVLLYPILFNISSILIMLLFILFNSKLDINDSVTLLNYINENTFLILIIQGMIFIPIFYFIYRNYCMDKTDFSIYTIIKIILLATLLSIGLNFLIIASKIYLNIDIANTPVTYTIILGTGILGPIIEELLFRGIVYGKLKTIFNDKTAFLFSVIIFAIFHTGGIFQILFAFIIGYYLTYIYKKYHDIRLSMVVHITVNMTSILVSPLLLALF